MNKQKRNRYTVGFFINKFKKIPAKNWICGDFSKKLKSGQKVCCALGFCGETKDKGTKMAESLQDILNCRVENINDGHDSNYSHIKGPKNRILQALKDVKNGLFN